MNLTESMNDPHSFDREDQEPDQDISDSHFRSLHVRGVLLNKIANGDDHDAIHVRVTHEGEDRYPTYLYRSELLKMLEILDQERARYHDRHV